MVEDDHAGEISNSVLVSIGSHLPGQTLHIRSFSKSHGPDLRMAAIGGAGDVIDGINHRRLLGPGWSSRLLQAVLVELLTDDVSRARVADARETYRERRIGMTKLFRERGIATTGRDGINLWCRYPASSGRWSCSPPPGLEWPPAHPSSPTRWTLITSG